MFFKSQVSFILRIFLDNKHNQLQNELDIVGQEDHQGSEYDKEEIFQISDIPCVLLNVYLKFFTRKMTVKYFFPYTRRRQQGHR